MSTTLWIVLGLALILALGYVLALRGLFRKSRELDKRIDYNNIHQWKDGVARIRGNAEAKPMLTVSYPTIKMGL